MSQVHQQQSSPLSKDTSLKSGILDVKVTINDSLGLKFSSLNKVTRNLTVRSDNEFVPLSKNEEHSELHLNDSSEQQFRSDTDTGSAFA